MALAHAMWTHGYSVHVEHPERGIIDIKGWGARYTSNADAQHNWFHFAIPTPVIVNSNRLRVGSVLVRFKTGNGAAVKVIFINDGENGLGGNNNLHLTPTDYHVERVNVVGQPEILWGLGISVRVEFTPYESWVEFSAAGCDFL